MKILFAGNKDQKSPHWEVPESWEFDFLQTFRVLEFCPQLNSGYEILICSSPYTQKAIEQNFEKLPPEAFVVGSRSVEMLMEIGYKGSITSFNNIEELAMGLRKDKPGKLAYFCGEDHLDVLAERLEGRGFHIQKIISYKTELIYPEFSDFDAYELVVVLSPRSAQSLLRGKTITNAPKWACLGNTTATALEEFGINNPIFPAEANLNDLWDKLIKEAIL